MSYCDKYGSIAYLIIAINNDNKVIIVVRIHEIEIGLLYGGSLGVYKDYRTVGIIGKGLINKAVTTANIWQCDSFLATIQLPNLCFCQQLNWYSLKEITIGDQPPHLMEVELDFYPPINQSCPILPL